VLVLNIINIIILISFCFYSKDLRRCVMSVNLLDLLPNLLLVHGLSVDLLDLVFSVDLPNDSQRPLDVIF